MNLRRRYIVINTERSLAIAICKSAPHMAFEIWRDHGHLVTQGRANEYFLGIFLSMRGLKQLASIFKNRYILSNILGTISVLASFSFLNMDPSL